METILRCSSRTVAKIIRKLELECFNCGWADDVCDLHHILPKAKGGSDDGSNLTYICPNCHRLAHAGKLNKFKTFDEVVGDKWKQFYKIRSASSLRKPTEEFGLTRDKILEKARKTRSLNAEIRAKIAIKAFKSANIDVSVYGWINKAASAMQISPQKIVKIIQRYEPSLLNGARLRSNTKIQEV